MSAVVLVALPETKLPSASTARVANAGSWGIGVDAHGLIQSSGSSDATRHARRVLPNRTADTRVPRGSVPGRQ